MPVDSFIIKNKTMTETKPPFLKQVPAYRVKINTSAFQYQKPALLQKIQQEYLPKYWELMHMDQKRVGPSCEDRLSELNTSQIDRIIDMEKIRCILNDKKQKKKEIFYELNTNKTPNRHSHIYQANFLAKINALAIKRNIRHETSQQFDAPSYQTQFSENGKKLSAMCKYKKSYSIDCSELKRSQTFYLEEEQQKPISQIDDQLNVFEQNLQKNKRFRQSVSKRKKRKFQDTRLCNKGRWFSGMSKLAFQMTKSQREQTQISIQRSPSVDIESQLSKSKQNLGNELRSFDNLSSFEKTSEKKRNKYCEPLEKFKIGRLCTIE